MSAEGREEREAEETTEPRKEAIKRAKIGASNLVLRAKPIEKTVSALDTTGNGAGIGEAGAIRYPANTRKEALTRAAAQISPRQLTRLAIA